MNLSVVTLLVQAVPIVGVVVRMVTCLPPKSSATDCGAIS